MGKTTTPQTGAPAQTSSTNNSSNVEFFTWEEFRELMDIKTADVVRNPHTDKLFLASGPRRWKCQGDLDPSLPYAFLVEDGNYDGACLVNVANNNNVVFSLPS